MDTPVFIYARYSSQEQGRGKSLVRQFEDCGQFAIDHGWRPKGWIPEPDDKISDKGRSAFHGANRAENGSLYQFERRVEKGFYRNGAYLICEHLDRVSRQGWEEVHNFLKLCTSNGFTVATRDGNRIYPAGEEITPALVMEIIWKGEGSRNESVKKSERGLKNWEYKVQAIEAGDRRTNTGQLPAWLERSGNGDSVLNRHRAKVLREVFDLYVDGIGLPTIVNRLNARGEPTWGYGGRNTGNGWNTAYLGKLLKNRAVLGEYEPMSRTHGGINETSKGIRVPDHYPQAIPADLFQRAQAQIAKRRFSGGGPAGAINNLFSGSAFCRDCGAPMYFQSRQKAGKPRNYKSKLDGRTLVYQPKTSISYLQCDGNRRLHKCANNTKYRYEYLEPAVLDAVLSVSMDDRQFQIPDAIAALTADIAEHERLIQAKRFNLDSIVESLGEHFIKALAQKAAEIEREIDGHEEQLSKLRGELGRNQGSSSPEEYLQRVHEVKASLTSEDELTRLSARQRVRSALSHLTRIVCSADGVAEVTLANGLMAWRFNQEGELLDSFDLRQRLDLHHGLSSGVLAGNAQSVRAIIRRSANEPR